MSKDLTINARVFAALNENPDATIEELMQGDKRSSVSAVRNFWFHTRHKSYRSSSSVPAPVERAREILLDAAVRGLTEAQGRDEAIDAGIGHGTAFSVAASVYRDFRRQEKSSLRSALLTIARRAERTAQESGKEKTTISKWKEFGFESAEAMADHLELLYHRQNGLCALSQVRMSLEQGEWCVSPDRKESDGHYTPENLQLVANCVNSMKGSTPNLQFLAQLEKIRKAGG